MTELPDVTYWYLNTNERGHSDDESIDIWFSRGLGFTCDSKFGPPLAKLNVNDIVFMYRSRAGIIGTGTVLESWDGRAYTDKSRLLNYDDDLEEFRIRIDWFADLRGEPLNGNEVIGNSPAQFLESIAEPSFRVRAEKLATGQMQLMPNSERVYKEGGRQSGQSIGRVNRNSRLAKDKIASVPAKDRVCECCGESTQPLSS